MAFCFLCLVWTASGSAPLDSSPCERGLMAGARRFRFREEPGPGADGAMLEVRVPQVRAAAPTWKRPWLECWEWGILQFPVSFISIRSGMKPGEGLNVLQ